MSAARLHALGVGGRQSQVCLRSLLNPELCCTVDLRRISLLVPGMMRSPPRNAGSMFAAENIPHPAHPPEGGLFAVPGWRYTGSER